VNSLLLPFIFVPLLPLAGALKNKTLTIIFSVVAWALMLGVFTMNAQEHEGLFFAAQLPLLLLSTILAFHFVKKHVDSFIGEPDEQQETTDTIRARHKELKETVAQIEKEENQSLQVYAVAKGLAEALSWKDMAPRLTSGIQRLFGAYEFLLYALDQNSWVQLHRRGSWTNDPPVKGSLPESICFLRHPHVAEVVPVLCVPIYSMASGTNRMAGVLFLKSPATDRSEQDLIATAQEFGEHLSMALNKALLFTQMEIHSRVDGLTGVFRRQPFMDRLDEEFKRAAVFHTPFSLMMIDIDHFKAVNDSHGHAAGDAVLAKVGELIKNSIYETDVVGRYGGEEFVILMPKAQADGVMRKAEALRQAIEREPIKSGFEQLHVTVSIGVAHFPAHGRSGTELISKRIERCMRRRKVVGIV
jgi:diguanylate cyclase (GGDEF)-like protein